MKICVLGLDCAAPEIVFGDDRLVNLRRLMGNGMYGRLESVIPPITVPAWMCMTTSQDPGSLGVYGFRNRSDHSYDKLSFANSASIKAPAIWDHLDNLFRDAVLFGNLFDKVPVPCRPVALAEAFRGEVMAWVRLDGDGGVARCHLRDASWFQWPLLEAAIKDNIVADFPLCNKSFNCSYSGHDL